MKRGQKVRSGQRRRKQGRTTAPQSLAGHKAFVPLLGVWGALLGGLVVLVLPGAMVSDVLAGTLIGTWGDAAQPALAAVTAATLGLALVAVAAYRHAGARVSTGPSVAEYALRKVTPIDPARDLGARRLDDPVEVMPFSTAAWRDADLAETRADAPAPSAQPEPEAEPGLAPAPVALDLSEFAELPGRNAVWVEEVPPAAAPPSASQQEAPADDRAVPSDPVADIRARRLRAVTALPPVPGAAALNRLRAMPTEALSLAEMVERFAGALHEHRETQPVRALGASDLAAREAALAEALKALAALSGGTTAPAVQPSRDEPLRDALAQLQPRRGAA